MKRQIIILLGALCLLACRQQEEVQPLDFSLSSENISITRRGKLKGSPVPTFTVKSNAYWTLECSEPWLKFSLKGAAAGTTQVSFEAEINPERAARTAVVSFETLSDTPATLTIRQSGLDEDIIFEPVSCEAWSSGEKCVFQVNDRIKIEDASGEWTEFYATAVGAEGATFTTDNEAFQQESARFYAAYTPDGQISPSDMGGGAQKVQIGMELPRIQEYVPGLPLSPMTAVSGTRGLEFSNALSMLRLDITGDMIVSSIDLGGSAMCGSGHVCPDDGPAFVADPSASNGSVTLKCTPAVTLDAQTPVSFYIALPPGAHGNVSVLVRDIAGTDNYSFEAGEINLQRNEMKVIAQNCVIGERTQSLNAPSWYGLDESAGPQYANCYIVTGAGKYMFDATVAGNGSSSELFYTPGPLSPASAEILWSDTAGLIGNVELMGGSIKFVAGEAKGNAVIAARNAAGNIIWSWHIWCTDQPAIQTVHSTDATYSRDHKLMDRNIGATSADPDQDGGVLPTRGLFFQWGRKDPFPAWQGANMSNYGGDVTTLKVYDGVEKLGLVTTSATNGTLEYAIANPDKFIAGAASSGANSDWISGSNINLWGNANDYKFLAYEGVGKKTIYDPCPAGYKVAPTDIFKDYTKTVTDNRSFDSKSLGYWLNLAEGRTWVPLSGFINYNGQYGHVGNYGRIWLDCPAVEANYTSTYVNYNKAGSTFSSQGGGYRSLGTNVRCVKTN